MSDLKETTTVIAPNPILLNEEQKCAFRTFIAQVRLDGWAVAEHDESSGNYKFSIELPGTTTIGIHFHRTDAKKFVSHDDIADELRDMYFGFRAQRIFAMQQIWSGRAHEDLTIN